MNPRPRSRKKETNPFAFPPMPADPVPRWDPHGTSLVVFTPDRRYAYQIGKQGVERFDFYPEANKVVIVCATKIITCVGCKYVHEEPRNKKPL